MKNTKLFLAIIGIFAFTSIFSSCSGDGEFKKLIVGSFQGNQEDKEMNIDLTHTFNADESIVTKAKLSSKNTPEPMSVSLDIQGKYSIIDGYIFIEYSSLTSEAAEMKEILEKQFIGKKDQYKIAILNDKELKLENENEKLLFKRLK